MAENIQSAPLLPLKFSLHRVFDHTVVFMCATVCVGEMETTTEREGVRTLVT